MTESLMDRVREILLFVAAIIAVFSFILAAYEGANQRVPSATFLGVLAIACTFLVFMPKLEVFKVWGIEARLSKTLDRAEEILGKLTRLSAISARASYLTIAWGNRFDSPRAQEKQAVLDDIDAQLTELKVSEEERRTIQRPFVSMMKLDFYFLFHGVLQKYAQLINTKLVADIHADPNNRQAHTASMNHSELITYWTKEHSEDHASKLLERYTLEEVLSNYLPKKGGWLNDAELAIFEKFKKEVVRLNADSEKKGGYTTEAAEYYDKYALDNNSVKAEQLWKQR